MADGDSSRKITLAQLFAEYVNGDITSWDDERAYLEEEDSARLAELTADIEAHGIREPIRVCDQTKRVIDGHHRVIIAQNLGLAEVPVANAWENGWEPYQRGRGTHD